MTQAIGEIPWNIYYAIWEFRKEDEIIKEGVDPDPNIYQYATLHLKNKNVDLAIFFLGKGGQFSLTSKQLRRNKKIGLLAVENNPNSFQYVGKNIEDDDKEFKLAFQQNKDLLRHASERLEKINIQS